MSQPDIDHDQAVKELREQLWILRRDVASAIVRWPWSDELRRLDVLLNESDGR